MVKYVSWNFSGFIWSLFECILNLNVIKIQIIFQNLCSSNCKALISNSGRISLEAKPLAQPAHRAA
jgi:hypothetical protein